ncbi:RNA polymerase sigma factor [Sphingobacterium faecium]|uniref:RNA polymerase sigma factor n=1 Tax=Sphingobacterium faecium TaxID=34087 RepID=UPI003209DD7A
MVDHLHIFDQWVEDYSEALMKRALYLLSDRLDAEDLVQDVFIAAFDSYPTFKGNSTPLTWLMHILKNKTADFYRKKYRNGSPISLDYFFDETGSWKDVAIIPDWSSEDQNLMDDPEFMATMQHCLEDLPPKWKIPVKLYYLEEKKAPIVCQEMGISSTNLWKILQRSRLQLRACLENNWFNTKN